MLDHLLNEVDHESVILTYTLQCFYVCVCVCGCARARVCACVCVREELKKRESEFLDSTISGGDETGVEVRHCSEDGGWT